MSRIIYPPDDVTTEVGDFVVFLAGSIEMGKAGDWQKVVEEELTTPNLVILNPRRESWDSSWIQSIDNPQFKEQITWELSGIESSDLVLFYFDPNTKSPITLMELGICSKFPDKVVVCCPDGFWRKGNVDVVCGRYGLKQIDTLAKAICYIRESVENVIEEPDTDFYS